MYMYSAAECTARRSPTIAAPLHRFQRRNHMRTAQPARFRRLLTVATTAVAALALAACASAEPVPAGDGDAPAEETLQVAFISFAVANTYDEPMLAEIERVAAEN